MGRNLDDFFDSVMRHRFSYRSQFNSAVDGFTVDSQGNADFTPSPETIAELREHHAAGMHDYSAGYDPVDVQFSMRYCPDCKGGK